MPGRQGADDLIPGFEPETDVERALLEDDALRRGLAWGRPRGGHPEGAVGSHVADLLSRLEETGESGRRRTDLRFIAIVHDTFKYRQAELPRSPENHHARIARS